MRPTMVFVALVVVLTLLSGCAQKDARSTPRTAAASTAEPVVWKGSSAELRFRAEPTTLEKLFSVLDEFDEEAAGSQNTDLHLVAQTLRSMVAYRDSVHKELYALAASPDSPPAEDLNKAIEWVNRGYLDDYPLNEAQNQYETQVDKHNDARVALTLRVGMWALAGAFMAVPIAWLLVRRWAKRTEYWRSFAGGNRFTDPTLVTAGLALLALLGTVMAAFVLPLGGPVIRYMAPWVTGMIGFLATAVNL